MNEGNPHTDYEPFFRVVNDDRDQWEVVNHQSAVCGRVRRDGQGRFSVTRELWDGRWLDGFGARQEAANLLLMVQREVECIQAHYDASDPGRTASQRTG